MIGRILSELSYRKIFNNRFKRRPVIDIVRKLEEFKYKKLEQEKNKNDKSEKYQNYIDALNWVIYANKTDY